jgi:hypothetical protein
MHASLNVVHSVFFFLRKQRCSRPWKAKAEARAERALVFSLAVVPTMLRFSVLVCASHARCDHLCDILERRGRGTLLARATLHAYTRVHTETSPNMIARRRCFAAKTCPWCRLHDGRRRLSAYGWRSKKKNAVGDVTSFCSCYRVRGMGGGGSASDKTMSRRK